MQKRVPKYIMVKNNIKDRIKTGYYEPGDCIASESTLAETFNVSLITIKKALDLLVIEGLIYKQKGKGTFVTDDSVLKDNSKSMECVAFIIALGSEFNGQLTGILKGSEEYLSSKGMTMILKYSNHDIEIERQEIEQVINQGIKGLLLFSNDPDRNIDYLLSLRQANLPYVLVDRFTNKLPVSFVTSDNMGGTYHATEMLISYKHKSIAFLTSSKYEGITSAADRRMGYLSSVENQRNVCITPHIYIQEENGIDNLCNDIKAGEVSAVLTVCGDIAGLFISECIKKGISIPDDVSMISFDEVTAKLPNCEFTIVEQNFSRMGYEGARLLCHSLDNKDYYSSKSYIPTRIILRDSVKEYKALTKKDY